jgi:hypothetical protein
MQEVERSQAEQCNGDGHRIVESSSAETADAVQEQESVQEQATSDGSDTHNVGTSEHGILKQRESQTADGEDTTDGEDLPV